MNNVEELDDISVIETELSEPNKGKLSIKLNFKHRLLTWRESDSWNRNFTRSLNQFELKQAYEGVETVFFEHGKACSFLQDTIDIDKQHYSYWTIYMFEHKTEPYVRYCCLATEKTKIDTWLLILEKLCRHKIEFVE